MNVPSTLDMTTNSHAAFANVRSRTETAPEMATTSYKRVLSASVSTIQHELIEVERIIASGLRVEDRHIQSMLDHVKELGGKRLRPCLALLSAKACGGITQETIRLAASLELVHTATLVHDDILDHAENRRHRPTLHRINGVPSSVLIGDWLFTHAYELANQGSSTIPGRWIASAAKHVCEGEIKQGALAGDFRVSMDEHLQVLSLKTGALCRVACALGAWSAGMEEEVCNRFGEFGEHLGVAFQIYDDWLDVWGDETRTGKTLGTDLEEFKPTIPSLYAIDKTFQGEELSDLLTRLDRRDSRSLTKVRSAMATSDASEFTLKLARRFTEQSVASLTSLRSRPEFSLDSIDSLCGLAVAATHRAA
jgi:octaprenyl-diphosphate synthase